MEDLKREEIKYPYLNKNVVLYTRKCGHKIVIAYKPGGLTNISSWVKTGSINENDENNGISHFLEHVMFKGTEKHKAGDFDRILEAKGAIVNAATWKDYTFYYVTLPAGKDNKDFYKAIELHADMMLNPVFPPEELGEPFEYNKTTPETKRERSVVIEEIGMREDQPWTKVYNNLNENMYENHPYKRDVIGKKTIISSIPRDTIDDYYKKHYAPNKITTIAIISDECNEEDVLNKIVSLFDFKSRKESEIARYEIDPLINQTKYIEDYAQVTTGFLMFGFRGPIITEFKDVIALDMLNIILGDGQSSRLYQNLIENINPPVYNMISSEHYHFKDGTNFFIQANFKADKKDQAIDLIKKELRNLLIYIEDNEFKKAKKKIKVQFANESETVSDIADTIGHYMTVVGSLKPIENYLDILEEIDKSYLISCAEKYLNIDSAVISVLLPIKGEEENNAKN